jgi:type II secretory pathway pseudopilin PulG
MGIAIRPLRPRSVRSRLAAVILGLLVVIAAIGLAVAVRARARAEASEELRLAARQVVRGLETRHQQLVGATRALADDAGLKRAAASGDQESARAILADHQQRMGADLLVLVSPKGTVASDSLQPARLGASFPLSPILDEAERNGEASRIVVMDGGLYWLAFVPLLSPVPIAWLCAGLAIDDRSAAELRRPTGLHVSFVRRAGAGFVVHASTLGAGGRDELQHRLSGSPTASTIRLGGSPQAIRAEALSDEVLTVLLRPLADALRPYRHLFLLLAALGGAGLVLTTAAAVTLAKSKLPKTRPQAD